MQIHRWRSEPLHDIIGKPNSVHHEIVYLCGHVDSLSNSVCIRDEFDHRIWERRNEAELRGLETQHMRD